MALEWVFLDHFSVDVEGSILESELQYIDISCTLLEHGSANVSCGRPNNTLGGARFAAVTSSSYNHQACHYSSKDTL